ncbi:hypothetical protein ACGFNX_04425 [Streptomyces sp. NPDC048723]|uniref:hypothetical protein n=1 Tax=Streptomyces sp. NPDC048723 TaxID=3365589 RepID=UPI003713D14F
MAEAMVTANLDGAVVLADDFGDDVDTGAAEYLAALLRRGGRRLRVRRCSPWS